MHFFPSLESDTILFFSFAVIRLNVQLSTVEEDAISGRTLELVRQLNGCLRVLENVTFMNVENQQYLLELGQCSLVRALSK